MSADGYAPIAANMRIGTLQILRFVAAALVMIGHIQQEIIRTADPVTAARYAFIPFDWGLGVDIFFVISGFVMYYLTHAKFGTHHAPHDFLRRRLTRIVPLYWITTTIVLAIALATTGKTGDEPLYLPNVIASYFFLPGPRCGEYCFPVYTLGWTLNYEMLFYTLFAIAMFFSRKLGLIFIVAALGALAVGRLITPPSATMLHFWGYSMTGEFLIGIYISHLFLSSVRVAPFVCGVMLVLGAALAVVFYQTDSYETLTRLVTGGIPAALLVAAVVLGMQGSGGSFAGRALILGGDASYALYLTHPFAIKGAGAIAGALGLMSVAPWLFIVLVACVAIVGAVIVHLYCEMPMLRWLNRITAPRNIIAGASVQVPERS